MKTKPKLSPSAKKTVPAAPGGAGDGEKPGVGSIEKLVRESRAENNSASAPSALKRGPGRPRKAEEPAHDPFTGAPMQSDTGDAAGAPELAAQSEAIPTAALAAVLQVPFRIARAKTGYDGFELDDATASSFAPMLDQVIKHYFPDAGASASPALGLGIGLGAVAVTQYLGYLEWKREVAAPRKVQADHEREKKAPSPGEIAAADRVGVGFMLPTAPASSDGMKGDNLLANV